jgi:hypothetical protein
MGCRRRRRSLSLERARSPLWACGGGCVQKCVREAQGSAEHQLSLAVTKMKKLAGGIFALTSRYVASFSCPTPNSISQRSVEKSTPDANYSQEKRLGKSGCKAARLQWCSRYSTLLPLKVVCMYYVLLLHSLVEIPTSRVPVRNKNCEWAAKHAGERAPKRPSSAPQSKAPW